MSGQLQCSRCGKRFGSKSRAQQHIDTVHAKRGAEALPYEPEEREQSMGEIFADALLNRAMGVDNPDWLEDMLP